MTDDLVDLLVSTDDPEVRRLTAIVDRLPESRRAELMSTLLRAVVTYEGTEDPHVLECFASAVRVTLRLHAADAGYVAALERAAAQQLAGRQLSRDEVAALFDGTIHRHDP
ncbi:MAG: hypothetical protein ACRD0V_07205 [Acidimicrobiales bacterium]